MQTVKIMSDYEWDKIVQNTYNKPYVFQQQDGCKDRITEYIKVPEYERFKGKHLKVNFMSCDDESDIDSTTSQNSKIKRILDKISESGGIEIEEPTTWQEEIRRDRSLY